MRSTAGLRAARFDATPSACICISSVARNFCDAILKKLVAFQERAGGGKFCEFSIYWISARRRFIKNAFLSILHQFKITIFY